MELYLLSLVPFRQDFILINVVYYTIEMDDTPSFFYNNMVVGCDTSCLFSFE